MNSVRWLGALLILGLPDARAADDARPITPAEPTRLFNGKDLTGLHTFLKKTKADDPQKVFSVVDGAIHVSGTDNGYIATDKAYQDYHLTVEYRWGKNVFGSKYVRNSGILLHQTGPDNIWPACIECQLAQGCAGDVIVIRGKSEKGELIPVQVSAETELAPDNRRHRWKKGGELKTFPPTRGQLWWSKHDWDFKELIDTRGKDDVESQLSDWTKVECICAGKKLTIIVNGTTVNECSNVFPTAGKILLQSEGFEMDFRRFELLPVKKN